MFPRFPMEEALERALLTHGLIGPRTAAIVRGFVHKRMKAALPEGPAVEAAWDALSLAMAAALLALPPLADGAKGRPFRSVAFVEGGRHVTYGDSVKSGHLGGRYEFSQAKVEVSGVRALLKAYHDALKARDAREERLQRDLDEVFAACATRAELEEALPMAAEAIGRLLDQPLGRPVDPDVLGRLAECAALVEARRAERAADGEG